MSKSKQPGSSVAGVRGTHLRRAALLGSVSMLSLLAIGAVADARPLGARSGTNPAAVALPSAEQATMALRRTSDTLARTNQALQAMRAAQNAARIAATAGATVVPNGQVPGGLVVDPAVASDPTLWSNAQLPKPDTLSNGRTRVEIVQTAPKAILTWQSFNVGRETDLYFNQTAGGGDAANWIALNRVTDPGLAPSRILGTIKAEGQVYVVNKNGIIFGGSSQVNVASLVASSLPISNEKFLGGLLTTSSSDPKDNPVFTSWNGTTPQPASGVVLVEAGAAITAKSGGHIMLFAPDVRNYGAIDTPSGQAILAAGSKISLYTEENNGVRGFSLLVDDAGSSVPGLVVNEGLITAPLGNITVQARNVEQRGFVAATTSVAFNGSIVLTAGVNANGTIGALTTGNLILADGRFSSSVTQILLDPNDTSKITDAQVIADSFMRLKGGTIYAGPGSVIQLKGSTGAGKIELLASQRVYLDSGSLIDASGTTDAVASASQNSVAVELRADELKDAPVVRKSPLYQKTIYIDRTASGSGWTGTPLADASGWISLSGRSLSERMMHGGTVTIAGIPEASGGNPVPTPTEFISMPGSIVDVAGGFVTYAAGFVKVSRLVTADGRIVNVSSAGALPALDYVGLREGFTVDHARWQVKEVYSNPLFAGSGYYDPGYVKGGNAGAVSILATVSVARGTIHGEVVIGERQRDIASQPLLGTLNLGGYGFRDRDLDEVVIGGSQPELPQGFSWTEALPANLDNRTAHFDPDWVASGMRNVLVAAGSKVTLPAGVVLDLGPGGSFAASADSIFIGGGIYAPGGKIVLAAASSTGVTPGYTAGSASLTLGTDAVLSTAGLWTKDVPGGMSASVLAIHGGTIELKAIDSVSVAGTKPYTSASIDLRAGSLIDVSGGAYVSSTGRAKAGGGGSLTITQTVADINSFTLGSTLEGFGTAIGGQFGGGGSLAISAPGLDIDILSPESMAGALTRQPAAGNLELSTEFFSAGGFASVAVAGRGMTLGNGVLLAPKVVSRLLDLSSANDAAPNLRAGATRVLLPQGVRAPFSLTLRSFGYAALPGATAVDPDAALLIGEGAVIRVDPRGSVTLVGDQLAVVSGTVEAAAGTINLRGGTYTRPNAGDGYGSGLSGQSVWLTGTGKLLARGTETATPQSNGSVLLEVLGGGEVNISSRQENAGGHVVLAPGSVIDVSGATGSSSRSPAGTPSQKISRLAAAPVYQAASPGGRISITALNGALLEGELRAHAGEPAVAGGTLTVALARHDQLGSSSSGQTFGWSRAEAVHITLQPEQTRLVEQLSLAYGHSLSALDANIPLSTRLIEAGGFDDLSLSILNTDSGAVPQSASILIAAGTNLSLPGQIKINAPVIDMVGSNGAASLSAGYFSWFHLQTTAAAQLAAGSDSFVFSAQAWAPVAGTNALSIRAAAMDLADAITLSGVRSVTFSADGDLRLSGGNIVGVTGQYRLGGALLSKGDIVLRAAQIYPTTMSTFSLVSDTKVRFEGNGAAASAPLSAGGELNVYAPVIEQTGVVRAPGGQIGLGCKSGGCPASAPYVKLVGGGNVAIAPTTSVTLADGSITSVSLNGKLVPLGALENGEGWYYPFSSGSSSTISAPPEKRLILAGDSVAAAPGALVEGSGGGDLLLYEFLAGPGGSKDAFAGADVYAILPGVQNPLAAFDAYYSQSTQPSLGKQVYLEGVPGLAAGTYTLQPGRYGLLPGAFQVKLTSTKLNAPVSAIPQTDGAYLTSGYLVSPFTNARDVYPSLFRVSSGAVVRQYSELSETTAGAFATAKATAAGNQIPRLPVDAGQLTILASSSLRFETQGLFNAGEGGRGGLADISADQIAVVTRAMRDAGDVPAAPADYPLTWRPILLAAEDLNKLGVESLLIGGTRTTQADGVHVTAGASAVVVANDASEPLSLPEMLLAALPKGTVGVPTATPRFNVDVPQNGTGQVVIRAGSVIVANGEVAPGQAQTLFLDGGAPHGLPTKSSYTDAEIQAFYTAALRTQGALVRVSNGVFVDTIRQDAPYATRPATAVSVVSGSSSGSVTLPPVTSLVGKITIEGGQAGVTTRLAGAFINLNVSDTIDVSPQVKLETQGLEIASNRITLGTAPSGATGLVLSQGQLAALAAVDHLVLRSSSVIEFRGDVTLGRSGARLTIDSAAVIAQVAAQAKIIGEQVTFQNLVGSTAPVNPVNADAAMEVTAQGDDARIVLGNGEVTIAGFDQRVRLSSSGVIVAEGDGSLLVRSALTLDAPVITAGKFTAPRPSTSDLPKWTAASYAIMASNGAVTPVYYDVALTNSFGVPALAEPVLGGTITVTGGNIDVATNVALPGGAFRVRANGELTVGASALLDASARTVDFRGVLAANSGGIIDLSATGALSIASGATLRVDGRDAVGTIGTGAAGTIKLAGLGGVILDGTLSGRGPDAGTGGHFILDTLSLSDPGRDYDALVRTLANTGLTGSWDIRARSGDITMAARTQTRDLTVSADDGSILLSGAIDASGATGGHVRLWAGNNLTLASTAMIDAHGAETDDAGRGGRVWLGAGMNIATPGALLLAQGSRIRVDAAGQPLGDVNLRAPRTRVDTANPGGTGINIAAFSATISGARSVVAEASKVYVYNQTSLDLTPTLFNTVFLEDARKFMAFEVTIKNALLAQNASLSSVLHLRPGIEIRNTAGGMIVRGDSLNTAGIDLSGSDQAGDPHNVTTAGSRALTGHFGINKEPIVLTLRSRDGLDFGTCTVTVNACATNATGTPLTGTVLTLGSLSDGFSSMAGGLNGQVRDDDNGLRTIPGGGASALAALFNPPATQGLGELSATYRLTAGADLSAANPLAADASRVQSGKLTVAGYVDARPTVLRVNRDYTSVRVGSYAPDFVEMGSLIRTGTGDIDIATAGDLVLQGTNSVIYTAGTGYNHGGTSTQPLPGFTQYSGSLRINKRTNTSADAQNGVLTLPPAAFPTMGGDLTLKIGRDLKGNSRGVIWSLAGLGSQNKLTTRKDGTFVGEHFTSQYQTADISISAAAFVGGNYRFVSGLMQYAWYPLFEYFAGGVGALGGGNVRVEAGGSISNVAIVLPTNGRDAGQFLTAAAYNAATQTGLLVQGGGALKVAAGGDIKGIDAFVQQGAMAFKAGGSILIGGDQFGSITTGTGDVTLEAMRDIKVADRVFKPTFTGIEVPFAWQYTISGLSLATNSNMFPMLQPYNPTGTFYAGANTGVWRDVAFTLQGVLTSVPDGAVTVTAGQSVTLDIGSSDALWNTAQGILPATLKVAALQGDITNSDRFFLYPDRNGSVDLLARGSIALTKGFVQSDADPAVMQTLGNIAAALSPTEFRKMGYLNIGSSANDFISRNAFAQNTESASSRGGHSFVAGADSKRTVLDADRLATSTDATLLLAHAPGLLHGDDELPAYLVALTGDLGSKAASDDESVVTLAKSARLHAGRDVSNLALIVQNNHANDVMQITAGRDVRWDTPRTADGRLGRFANSNENLATPAIEVGGPGEVWVQSGRSVDLGFTQGIVSIGNRLNPRLPNQKSGNGRGASITVLTGLGTTSFDYSGFLATFADPSSTNKFASPLVITDRNGGIIAIGAEAYALVLAMPEAERNLLANRLFFDLIKMSGRERSGAIPDSSYRDYERAYAAIDSLLGGVKGRGDFRGMFSQVRTKAGGDITILAPTGRIDVGAVALPTGFSYSASGASTGVVTEQGGTVRMYANGDINVNQSRVFTLNGGDIVLVSRFEDIDAGRGAKTVQAIQAPDISYDADGNISIVPVGSALGSGIQTQRTMPTTPAGDADLVAFEGAVDAGDAGIGVSGNLSVAARVVLNADNIRVGGQSAGVPAVPTTDVGSLAAASNSTAANSKVQVDPASTGNADRPSVIIVEVLGYGGGAGSEEEDRRREQRSDNAAPAYDPNGPVRIVGVGALTEEEKRSLRESERKQIAPSE